MKSSDNKKPGRAFGVEIRREARCDVTQLATFRVEAASEGDARAIAERMIAEDDDEICWSVVDDFDNEEAGPATIKGIGELQEGPRADACRNARIVEMLDELLVAGGCDPGVQHRVITAVERELEEIAEEEEDAATLVPVSADLIAKHSITIGGSGAEKSCRLGEGGEAQPPAGGET